MKTIRLIFVLTMLFSLAACRRDETHPTVPAPAPVDEKSSAPEPESAPGMPEATHAPVVEPGSGAGTAAVSVPGLRVVYLRGGNLWSWTDAGDSVQLTDTGDMSAISVSQNSQLLAFVRGRDAYTVNMDGTNARQWGVQADGGASLRFAPNSMLLAVASHDRIEIVDLAAGSPSVATTYPPLPEGVFPTVLWMPDSSAFKTIVPPAVAGGQAEFLYVFTTGTVASLAKFPLIGQPAISPDGGYVIYPGAAEGGMQTLFLMDSSGATRPYGEAGETAHVYGWLPDSKRFVFGVGSRVFMGDVFGAPVELVVMLSGDVRWLDENHFLALHNGKLTLGDLNGASVLIDSDVTEFDVVPAN